LNYNDTLTKDRVHRLQLVYNETAFLKGINSTLVVPAGFKQRVKVPKQTATSESKLGQVTESISAAIQALTAGNAAFSVFAQSSLSHMWAFINSLQLVLHLPMNKVAFPEATTNFIQPLIKVVTFDVTSILDLVGLNVELFTFTETDPFSENADLLGYGSQNTVDNLGIINLVIAIMCLEVIFLLILSVLEKWWKDG